MIDRPGPSPRHPDFAPDNEEATKHGAHSERRWRPVAQLMAAEAIAAAPWLARAPHRWAVEAWAATEAKAALVDAWLDHNGLLDDAGKPHPANALADRLHARAEKLRRQLGLDPMSFALLLSTVSTVVRRHPSRAGAALDDDLMALLAEGRAALERGTRRLQAGEEP